MSDAEYNLTVQEARRRPDGLNRTEGERTLKNKAPESDAGEIKKKRPSIRNQAVQNEVPSRDVDDGKRNNPDEQPRRRPVRNNSEADIPRRRRGREAASPPSSSSEDETDSDSYNGVVDRRRQRRAGRHTSSQRHHVQDVLPTKFDGSQNYRDFVRQFKVCSRINHWSEQLEADMLLISLTGVPWHMVHSKLRDKEPNFELMDRWLRKRYDDDDVTAACMRRLDAMKWKASEDIRIVQDKITGELEKAFPRASDEHLDAMALQYFYKVLDDEDIERSVKVMMPKTMSKAVQLALKIQHLSKKKDAEP